MNTTVFYCWESEMRKIRVGQQATYEYMDCKSVENLGPLAYTVLNQWKMFLYNKTNKIHQFSQIYSGMKLYMFRTVPLSIIRSLFTVHSSMVYVTQVCRQLSSRTRMELSSILVLLEFHVRKNMWKLVHLVGFIIKKFVTMRGPTNVKKIQWKRVSSNWQMVKTHIMHGQNRFFGNKIFSTMSVTINQSIRRNVPQDLNFHQYHCHLRCSKIILHFTHHPNSRVEIPRITIPRRIVTANIACDCKRATYSLSVDSEILTNLCK
jgi:hypothetical protein